MAEWDPDLRRRQQRGDIPTQSEMLTGVMGDGMGLMPFDGGTGTKTGWRRWRPMLVPVVLLLLGLILGMWGPLPGLGLFLMIGGAMAVVVVSVQVFLRL